MTVTHLQARAIRKIRCWKGCKGTVTGNGKAICKPEQRRTGAQVANGLTISFIIPHQLQLVIARDCIPVALPPVLDGWLYISLGIRICISMSSLVACVCSC
ncbi:unnamed protein product [Linum tenue]|uniref:Uncharacterized protein n=1 Tax=Linum tenue TaxID=586396 RepID=A0AAV0I765_9ROSI|nr:unnamed protein product [Linum tenue]